MNSKSTKLTRCSFCRYWSGSSCMVTPSSYYCKDANDEYYQYINNNKYNTQVKEQIVSIFIDLLNNKKQKGDTINMIPPTTQTINQ